MGRIAAGDQGYQAASVDGIKRDVRAHGGIDRSFDLRLILDAGFSDPAREIDHGFLFGKDAQLAGGVFESGQLAVGVEDVEFGFVGGETAAVVALIAGCGGEIGQIGALANGQFAEGGDQGFAIVGPLLDDFDGRRVGHDFDQVGRGHLGLKEFDGGFLGSQLVRGLHRGHVEEHAQQAAILVADGTGCRGGYGRLGGTHGRGSFFDGLGFPGSKRQRRQRFAAELLEFENSDVLTHAVFENFDVVFGEIGDRAAGLVADGEVDDDQLGVGFESRVLGQQGYDGQR